MLKLIKVLETNLKANANANEKICKMTKVFYLFVGFFFPFHLFVFNFMSMANRNQLVLVRVLFGLVLFHMIHCQCRRISLDLDFCSALAAVGFQ